MRIWFFKPNKFSKSADGLISRYLNRWLSVPVSRALIKKSISPNQVTIAISLLSIPMLVAGINGSIIIVGVIFQLASILDGVDGELARMKYITSEFGALLDTVFDYCIDSFGILALGFALISRSMLTPTLIITLVSLTISVRLISQFVVKMAPYKKAHLIRDTRDVATFLIFIGCILTEILGPWFLVIVLVAINLWRLDNMIYRLFYSWRISSLTSQSEVLLQKASGISSRVISKTGDISGKSEEKIQKSKLT